MVLAMEEHMSTFVILLHDDEPDPSAKLRVDIEHCFAGSKHYKFSDSAYLVTGARSASDVSRAMGFDDAPSLHAAVLELTGSFSGRSWMNLWEWLKAADKGEL